VRLSECACCCITVVVVAAARPLKVTKRTFRVCHKNLLKKTTNVRVSDRQSHIDLDKNAFVALVLVRLTRNKKITYFGGSDEQENRNKHI
jgi:hypothetical protein